MKIGKGLRLFYKTGSYILNIDIDIADIEHEGGKNNDEEFQTFADA